jgi:diguanylate cyclase (GGDEF)-like protein
MPVQLPALLFLALLVVFGIVIVQQRRRLTLLEFEARHDVLTGLPNRRALAHAWDRMTDQRALILIDLVGFKAVNDSHGHIVGDALLQKVASRLRDAVPAPGLMARWGGDEFVALVPAHTAEGLQGVMARAWAEPYDLSSRGGPREVRIGGRIGLSVGETDLERALDTATHGLMEAKAAA